MPEHGWAFRLQHILDAIEFVSRNLEGVTFEEFASNEVLVRAILHTLEMAGEAARAIPQEVTQLHDSIPWRGLNDFRNVIVHQYFRVELDLVWRVIHRDFLPLRPSIESLLDLFSDDAQESI